MNRDLPRTPTHDLVPGGAHTYSKGDDQFPANAPRFLERGEGAYVWDDKGTKFLDWTMGLRSMTLGYGYPGVNEAAIEQIKKGNNFGRPSRIETEAARDLVDLVPSADMVKFAKNGSTVTTAAVKLARSYTGRDKVMFCREHPFFSYDNWFIGTTSFDGGIPEAGREMSVPFHYNDIDSVERAFAANSGQIACLIMEAASSEPPKDDFLRKVQTLCRANGAVFILDEMITGFRWHLNGAQAYFGIEPDLATFGKGIANGFSVSALVGRREIMELGGLFHDKKRVFLISTTHGAENCGLAAMRAALRIYRTEPVIDHIWAIGGQLIAGLNAAAGEAGIGDRFLAFGYPCSPYFTCKDASGKASMEFRTLFVQEMIRAGVLAPYFAPSYSHRAAEVETTVAAARKAFAVYARALSDGWEKYVEGHILKPVFRPYN